MKLPLLLCISAVCLISCATSPEAKERAAWKRVAVTPFDQLPVLYTQLEKERKITPERAAEWRSSWHRRNRDIQAQDEADRREWASMTPAQKRAFQRNADEQSRRFHQSNVEQERIYNMQQREAQSQRVGAALQGVSDNIRHQQELDAYNQRTRTLNQPVNVYHSGYINHDVRVRQGYGY